MVWESLSFVFGASGFTEEFLVLGRGIGVERCGV